MHWNIFDFALLSSILACLGQPEKAVKIRGACHHLRSELGLDDHPYEQSVMEQTLADIKSRLDKSTFAKVWAEGQRMTYEQLRDYVLVEEEEPKT
jgi:hypothetical protein